MWRPPLVVEVREESPCREAVRKGDRLLKMNGMKPRDVLDCLRWGDEAEVRMELLRDGEVVSVAVRKEEGMPLGLVFDEPVFDGVMTCRNRCRFCFVDQMPPGLRSSLYMKDDDYRLSFYYGNFITLNNLSREEVKRIEELRLSPLYVSLHTTDPALRSYMMGGEGRKGLEILRRFLMRGLEIHLQVVCCPGINDGDALRQTFQQVLARYPAASLGVVPVGVTRLADPRSPFLQPHDRESASRVLEIVEDFQGRALEMFGRRLFHASDEFYLLAEREFPPADDYEGYPQLENGVGMSRKFLEEIRECGGRGESSPVRGRGILTGIAGEAVIRRVFPASDTGPEVVAAVNGIFGESVTVTSLLGGRDVLRALHERAPSCRELLIPETLLREGRFLDDITVQEVERRAGYRLLPIPVNGAALLSGLAECAPSGIPPHNGRANRNGARFMIDNSCERGWTNPSF